MKKILAITLLMAMALCGMGQAIHFDFSITNSTGYEIYYRITDTDLHQVVVTYPCQNGDNYWWGYDKPEGKLILMDTVTYNSTVYTLVGIDDHAFCGCSGLRGTFEFPESIQTIGAGAFKGCYNLSGNLVLPAVMTRIEDEAFSGCSSFTGKLALPDSIQYVGNQAFLNCSGFRGMLMLPASLSFIGEQAFKGVTSINAISIKAKNVPTTAADAFDEIPTWITVNVPYDMKEAYQDALGWSRFAGNTVEKSIWTGNAEPWTEGDGTEENPYLIESAENLAWLAKSVNEAVNMEIDTFYSPGGAMGIDTIYHDVYAYQSMSFRQVVDIDLQKSQGLQWTPIGSYRSHGPFYSYFSGKFDGFGHEISNYSILVDMWSNVTLKELGLFGIAYGAELSNIYVKDIKIVSMQYLHEGGILGNGNRCVIKNCHSTGTLQGGDEYYYINGVSIGGIVGKARSCLIKDCSSKMDIFANNDLLTTRCNGTGGIVGAYYCESHPELPSGIINCNYEGAIRVCGITVNADDSMLFAGGIAGICINPDQSTGNAKIEHCYSRGSISSVDLTYTVPRHISLGGIVGYVASIDTLIVMNCYTNDSIIGKSSSSTSYIGGIVGKASPSSALIVKNCYHAGAMVSNHKAGILAQNTNMTIVRNCFFDKTVAPDDGFGLPLESDYMKTEAFVQQLNNGSSVFRMDTEPYENDGYPVFGTDGLIFVGAEWYYQLQNDDGSITYQHLQCVGDTTIGNERPKIIVRTNTIYDRYDKTTVTHEYIYEENGVVYWWNQTLGKFTVLYDFGAEVGDEWTIEVGNETITTKVYATEVQYIDGIPYKKLAIADPNEIFNGNLLSTIGHSTSFFPEKLMNQGKGFRVEGLRCYWLNGDLILKTTNDDCDAIYAELHNGINEDGPSTGSGTFTVYPNPTDGILFVQTLRATSLPDQTYRITNLLGQTLLQGLISAENQQINIATLPAGMYFICVDGQTVKFVVR